MRRPPNKVGKYPLGSFFHCRVLKLKDSHDVIVEYFRAATHLGLLTYPAREQNALRVGQLADARGNCRIRDLKVAATTTLYFRAREKLPSKRRGLPFADWASF